MDAAVIGTLAPRTGAERYYRGSSYRQSGDPERGQAFPQRGHADTVELSGRLPAPFTPKDLEEAGQAAATMLEGADLSGTAVRHLRQDRVFAALAALQVMHRSQASGMRFWPPGIPRPSAAELEEAYRRLSQRVPGNTEALSDAARTAEENRASLLEGFRQSGFALFEAA